MTDVRAVDLGEWLNPPEHQLSGLATSEEELSYLQARAYAVRRQFVAEAAARAIHEKTHDEPLDDMALFESLPARNYMDSKDYKMISNFALSMMKYHVVLSDRLRYWRELTGLQAMLGGFSRTRNKYDDQSYLSEENFACAMAHANEIRESHYPVRFFMRGVRSMGQSALDLDTMRDWVEGRTDFDPGAYLYQWHRYLSSPGYDQPSPLGDTPGVISWPFVRQQTEYWDVVLEAKSIGDKHVPWLKRRQTFADCVTVLAPGLYLAPYIPDEVTDSHNFVDYDDVRRAAIDAGETKPTATTSTFNDLVYEALRRSTTLDSSQRYSIAEDHIRAPVASVKPGVIFMSRRVAEKVVEHIDQNHKNRRVVRAVGAALLTYADDVFDGYNELDLRLLT